jgi:hypothetical protein
MILSRYLSFLLGLTALAACSSSLSDVEPTVAGACVQSYEFGNYGCAEIVGTVVNEQQQPLPGISVGPVHLPDRGAFNTVYSDSDGNGRFKFRIMRFTAPETSPDTVSLYVRAADPRSAGVNIPARVRDSVLVNVTLAPVGRVPTPAVVVITLNTP